MEVGPAGLHGQIVPLGVVLGPSGDNGSATTQWLRVWEDSVQGSQNSHRSAIISVLVSSPVCCKQNF